MSLLPWRLACIGVVGIAAGGCGGHPKPDYTNALELADVSGTITFDGEPLSGAYVVFERVEERPRRMSFATTDANGAYRMQYAGDVYGVMPGQATVRITDKRSGEEGEPSSQKKVPSRYDRGSKEIVDIEPFGSHTFDFELTSK